MDQDNVSVLRAIVEYVEKSDCILEVKVMKAIGCSDLIALQKEMAGDVKFRSVWIFPTENEVGVTIVRVDFGGNVPYSVATEAQLKKICLLAQSLAHVTYAPQLAERHYTRFSSSMNWNFWLIGNRATRLGNVPPPGQFSERTLNRRKTLAAYQHLASSAEWFSIADSSVYIVCGERDSGKLTELVHYMLGSCCESERSCRTICVLQEEVEVLATVGRICEERDETVGSTIGYKLTINAQVGEMNNIVFCTAQTLIMSLVIKTFDKVVPELTHLIVDCSDQRPAGMSLLFSLVKKIMSQNEAIKLVLLCTKEEVQSWANFFEGAPVMRLPYNVPTENNQPNSPCGATLYHLDKILMTICTHGVIQSLKANLPKVDNALKMMANLQLAYGHRGLNRNATDLMDKLLWNCWNSDDATPFTAVLLPMLEHNRHMADYQHSDTRMTALMIAAAKGFEDVVRRLLELGANPYLMARKSLQAMDWCPEASNNRCLQLMLNAHKAYTTDGGADRWSLLCQMYHKLYNPYVVDQKLVVDIVAHICKRFASGNVLVVLPDYSDVLECLVWLRRSALDRHNIKFVVYHRLVTEDEFKDSVVYPEEQSKPNPGKRFCVMLLAGASLLELIPSLNHIHYVVDTGLKVHHSGDYAKGICIDRSCLATARTCRLLMWLAQRKCFMLYGKDRLKSDEASKPLPIKAVSNVTPPETILTALLCRTDFSTSTIEYLGATLFGARPASVGASLQLLHQIGAIERPLTVPTSLGQLLSHLDVGIHLGKALLYSILFRCVDPMLTIIAALKVGNPFVEPLDEQSEKEIVQLKHSLHSRTYSDCMVLLRLYHQWSQCKYTQTDGSMVSNYRLKIGAMEAISNARVEIMSMLRVLGIVKCSRENNIDSLNTNSTKWAIVKCCLAAGFYPQLAIADYEKHLLTTNCGSEGFKPHRLSVVQIDSLPAKWVIYGRKLDHQLNVAKEQSVQAQLLENTVITDWTVLLVCGIDRFDTLANGNMQLREGRNIADREPGTVQFIIDRKYTFQLPYDYYRAVSFIRRRLGQLFEHFSRNLLKTLKREETDRLVNYIGDILHQEDVSSMMACTLNDTRPKLKNPLAMGASWNFTMDMFDRM
ncbi:DExH-box ATP-dependent RNA helicase DExH6-like [Anopheles stephensi]|uniref:DExH-box ATP-dependent RNA helicase DExH6-like n=1 Tax=Anopheles stephensi TaxID=30069 RepID=UPI0007D5602C|nr:DExH-box ATP-dependent RNA helicase DExH6-like [Anopheles stephensi]